MATVTPPRNLEQSHHRVRSPLASLRGLIRSYVSIEGTAVCALYVALWFWIGMILDYGFFKVTTIDWVQELPWALRCGLLLVLASGLLAAILLRVVLRLVREFSDAALAIVLERRFPKVLGDQLITAVELSDPQLAATYGYSPVLVEETIHQAAERVGQVPVKEVFNWKRLYRYGLLVGLLTLVAYLLMGSTFAAYRAWKGQERTLAGFGELNDVSAIWFERNILLRNTIWPRKAMLEIVDFRDEVRIARDTAPPNLRVRAWKYVVADNAAPEGWRLLTWEDIRSRPELGGADLPAAPLDWEPRHEETGLTVDEVELYLAGFQVRKQVPGTEEVGWYIASDVEESGWRPLQWADLKPEYLGGLAVPPVPATWDPKALPALGASGVGLLGSPMGPLSSIDRVMLGPKYVSLSVGEIEAGLGKNAKDRGADAVRNVFTRLQRLVDLREALGKVGEYASDPANSRTVRKLIVPETVQLTYKGKNTTNQNPLRRVANNEYTGAFGELKESVTFTVRGEDYITARRAITVVDLPRLEKLVSEEAHPAYLYYRPSDDLKASDLRSRRQPFEGVQVSTAGDVTTIEPPAGTTVVLEATCTKPLQGVKILPAGKGGRPVKASEPALLDDERTFRTELKDVRSEQRFTFEFTDTDGVVGRRTVAILPREDQPPRVRDFTPDEVIRRTKEGYLVAVGARIPFKGKVRDDHGLARVRYAYTVVPGDFLPNQMVRSLGMLGAWPLVAPSAGTRLLGVGYLAALNRELSRPAAEGEPVQHFDLPAFQRDLRRRLLADGREEFLEKGTVDGLLRQKQKSRFRKLLDEFTLAPDEWARDAEPDNPDRWMPAQHPENPIKVDLPLWEVYYREKSIKEPDEFKTQRRYLVEVWLEAEDNDVEGELGKDGQPKPHVGPSGEKFTFVVVSENELLSKIAEEEEVKYRELLKAASPLTENRDRLRDLWLALSAGSGLQATDLNGFTARADALDEVLKNAEGDVKAVAAAYERIIKEMRLNQCRKDLTKKVFKEVAQPLGEVAEGNFSRTRAAVQALRKALDNPAQEPAARAAAALPKATAAKEEFVKLVAKLNQILSKMEGIGGINELIKVIRAIEIAEEDQYSVLLKRQKENLLDLLKPR